MRINRLVIRPDGNVQPPHPTSLDRALQWRDKPLMHSGSWRGEARCAKSHTTAGLANAAVVKLRAGWMPDLRLLPPMSEAGHA